jgi:hypothetical protein
MVTAVMKSSSQIRGSYCPLNLTTPSLSLIPFGNGVERFRSPCTSDVERDTQDTSPEEASRKRDTQDNPAGSFEDPKPHTPGRDPIWAHGGDGLP